MSDNLNKPSGFVLPKSHETNELKSNKEIVDVNEIVPRISSITNPVIILAGPRSSGKTVTLLRLAKYLMKTGNYSIKPNKSFRSDPDYADVCEEFNSLLDGSDYAPNPTKSIDFLLLDVYRNNKQMMHILEAPGEHFFDETKPNSRDRRSYFIQLMNSDLKKIFVFFFEKDMLKTDSLQKSYSDALSDITKDLKPKNGDKIIFLLNKVDKMDEIIHQGTVDVKEVKKYVYENTNYISLKKRIINLRNMDPVCFVPFSSGTFNLILNSNGKEKWILSNDEYPRKLWDAINRKPPFRILEFTIG